MIGVVNASGRDAIRRVEEGDRVSYKIVGQRRRMQPLEVVRTVTRAANAGDKRKEIALHGNGGERHHLSFNLTNPDPFEDALHMDLTSGNTSSPEEFFLLD